MPDVSTTPTFFELLCSYLDMVFGSMYPISASGIADSFVALGSMLSYRTDHDESGDDDMLWGQGTRGTTWCLSVTERIIPR